jgi:protein-tyrosine-phosphatase
VPQQVWDLPDPSGKSIAFMRRIRDEIEERVTKLLKAEMEAT